MDNCDKTIEEIADEHLKEGKFHWERINGKLAAVIDFENDEEVE